MIRSHGLLSLKRQAEAKRATIASDGERDGERRVSTLRMQGFKVCVQKRDATCDASPIRVKPSTKKRGRDRGWGCGGEKRQD